jgi:hypothetical protein
MERKIVKFKTNDKVPTDAIFLNTIQGDKEAEHYFLVPQKEEKKNIR